MAENYTVNYNINVNSAKAQEALTAFQTATAKLTEASKNLTAFQKKIDQTIAKFNQLAKKTPALDFKVANANKKLQSVITKLQTIERLAKKVHAINVTTTTKTGGRGSSSTGNGRSRGSSTVAPITGGTSRPRIRTSSKSGGSPVYRALGPTMIDTGGISAIDMLKGMGIAYGITGFGSLIGNAIQESVAYDNIMKTTRNILGTHDKKENFDGRFSAMERNVRDVGKLTKYTTTEVADATKFLAMAGLDIDAINQSIRPIANIALVGDTELGETADLVTNIMTGYSIAPEKMRRATDIMTMTFTSANTTLTEIAEAYKYSASLLHESGVSFEEATAAMGVLGNAGIKGSQAGTSMRTILANIVNPRSVKRDKAWKEVGVERFDENGQMRDLADIFQDLHDKNLDVSMYYRLFDRTAAQGAVSLAANIDVWNEIIRRNFMSDNLAQQLADEKINTMLGLWDQLTSAFEDQVLKAFEEQDSPIRSMLKELIAWVDSDEMLETIRRVTKALLDFIKMIVDFTKRLIALYNRFEVFIKQWIELQLQLSMVLIPLRAVRSLLQFKDLVRDGAKSIGMLTMQFGSLWRTLWSGMPIRKKMSLLWDYIFPSDKYIENTKKNNKKVAPDVIQRYNSIQTVHTRRMLRMGAGSMIGGALGAWAGSNIGEQGSGWNTAATIGLGLAGAVGGSYAANLLPLLFTNPVGWGILAVGAVAGVVTAIYKINQATEEAVAANEKWSESYRKLGIDVLEIKDGSELVLGNMRIISSSLLNETEKVQIAGDMWHRYWMEKNGVKETKDNSAPYAESNKLFKEDLENADAFFNVGKAFAPIVKSLGGNYTSDYIPSYGNGLGTFSHTLNLNGRKMSWVNSDGDMSEWVAVQLALSKLGADQNNAEKLQWEKYLLNTATHADSYKDFQNIIGGVRKDIMQRQWSTQWDYIDSEGAEQMKWGDITHSQAYIRALQAQMIEVFAAWENFGNVLKDIDSGNAVDPVVLQRVMFERFGPLFDPQYGLFGTEGWLQNVRKIYDNPNMFGINATSVQEISDYITTTFDNVVSFYNLLNNKYKPVFSQYLNRGVFENFLNPNYQLGEGGYYGTNKDGDIRNANGIKYRYDAQSNSWQQIGNDGKPISVVKPIPDKEFQNMIGSGANAVGNKNTNIFAPNSQNTNAPKANSADYKSHYNNGNAAPKQVIVRIDKLMNVESVDLSNPDNAAVISNLKGQLAQALIDVVHDFDETWHG